MSLTDRIHWNCSACGQQYKSPRQNAGLQVTCPCGLALTIPVPDEPVTEPKIPPATIRSEPVQPVGQRIPWNCPKCGQQYKTPMRMAGKQINCSKCNAELQVPTPEVQEPERLRWACDACDLTFQTTTDLAGQIIECPSCQSAIPVPDARDF